MKLILILKLTKSKILDGQYHLTECITHTMILEQILMGRFFKKNKDAPVYKSHAEYGFVEPIKYFKKNPAVSEIKLVKQDKNYNEFILSTLGYDTIQRPYAQHLIHYSYDIRNKTLKMINKYNLGERVRDTYYDDNKNRIYYVGESTGVLFYINLKLY